jgi:DNA repair exonuclease SbcCD ATPase subunit
MQETNASLDLPVLGDTPFPDLRRKPTFRGDPPQTSLAEDPADFGVEGPEELNVLRTENAELRQRLAGLEELLENASRATTLMQEQQTDQERMLEEKSEVIRELHQKLLDLQNRPAPVAPQEEELIALSEELERERKQLKDDEEALMGQMREMEVQMARERAELGRQRNDLQQLHNEIRHELVRASREAELRTRMQPFQRRHQDMTTPKNGDTIKAPQETVVVQSTAGKESKPKDSGILRRLFG